MLTVSKNYSRFQTENFGISNAPPPLNTPVRNYIWDKVSSADEITGWQLNCLSRWITIIVSQTIMMIDYFRTNKNDLRKKLDVHGLAKNYSLCSPRIKYSKCVLLFHLLNVLLPGGRVITAQGIPTGMLKKNNKKRQKRVLTIV